MKFLGAVWFGHTGIVLMNNDYEDKAYIGEGFGVDSHADVTRILRSGIPFPVNAAKIMIQGETKEITELKEKIKAFESPLGKAVTNKLGEQKILSEAKKILYLYKLTDTERIWKLKEIIKEK